MSSRSSGFTLIEILVAVAIMIIALTFGLPTFASALQNARVRTVAEEIQGGLRYARMEAIRRNAHVQFVLNQGGTGWVVRLASTADVLQSVPDSDGSRAVVLSATPADATTVTFDGFGRVPSAINPDGSASLTRIAVDNVVPASDSRDLRIVIPPGGGVRMCDPKVSDTMDPRTC